MSSLKSSQKPTLGMILQNPQSQSVVQNSPEKVVFPKINTKLKKTQFTKYRSAFISAQSCDLYLQSDRSLKTPEQPPTSSKLNTETILKEENWQSRAKIQLRKNLWKLNKNHHESYLSSSTQKVNLSNSQIKEVQNSKIQRKDKILIEPSHSTEIKRNDRVVLLTEIRQLDISPIQYAQTSREERPKPRKSEEINENIQRSNRMISLIEKNYRKGFFENSAQKDSLEKLQEKLGLFSYLKRNFVTKKEKLTPEKVREYFKTPSNKKLETKIDLVARSFLKQKIQGDYHSYQQVNKVRQQMSQQCIQKQIKQKNVEYRAEYNKKYNIPYLSFLSLPKKLKVKVLQNLSGQQKAKLK